MGGVSSAKAASMWSTRPSSNIARKRLAAAASFSPASPRNTIIAGTTDGSVGLDDDSPDCQGELNSRGNNLIGNSGGRLGASTVSCLMPHWTNELIGNMAKPLPHGLAPLGEN